MSLKSLALLVLLISFAILGSAHNYLAAERTLHAPRAAEAGSCCSTTVEPAPALEPIELSAQGPETQPVLPRGPRTLRRREVTVQGTWAPCSTQFATTASDSRGS